MTSRIETNESGLKKGVYLLPNLFTTGALFAGFYAIVAAMDHNFEYAAIAIFVAMILDGLDGRVARMTNTQSDFGVNYDSLSDMVSFGVAPSLVIYNCGVASFGKLGWLAVFIYTAATALRLARFNAQANIAKYTEQEETSKYFKGLPCPSAAGIIAGMVWVISESGIIPEHNFEVILIMALTTSAVGILMVSNIPYHSFKELDLKEHVPFISVLVVVLAYILIAWDPPKILFSIFTLYALSGIVLWLKNWWGNDNKLTNEKSQIAIKKHRGIRLLKNNKELKKYRD